MAMMFPVPIRGAVISPNQDRGSAIHHGRRGHDHGCRVDDGWRWGNDHDRRRCDHDRNPDTNGYPHPSMGRER